MITRNNYEEFFLLYVDNELSPAERQAVERFVDEHPDLKEEFDVLLQCKISPDEEASFPGIASLLKFGAEPAATDVHMPVDHRLPIDLHTPIDLHNYETWFLSYVDGELDEPARQAVIGFVRQHPGKTIELQRLQQTVSVPDLTIVFPDKALLYRKRKIVWLPFVRVAAAAVVLGAIGLLVFRTFRAGHTAAGRPPVASTSSPSTKTPVIKKQASPVTPAPADPYYLSKGGEQKAPANRKEGDDKERMTPEKDASEKDVPEKAAPEKTAPVLAKVELPGKDRTTLTDPTRPAYPTGTDRTTDTRGATGTERTTSTERTKGIDRATGADPVRQLAVANPTNTDRIVKVATDPSTRMLVTLTVMNDQTANIGRTNASFATQALLSDPGYPDDDTQEETASPRKNKLRGIFRRVTRALEKPSARESDDNKKVIIGGIQFALK